MSDWEDWDEDAFETGLTVEKEDAEAPEPSQSESGPTEPKAKKATKPKQAKKKRAKQNATEEEKLSPEEAAVLAKKRYELSQFEVARDLVANTEQLTT
jgi:hypothetical protein